MPRQHQNEGSSLSPKQKWESIPQEFKEEIIRNVWCTHCGDVVEILDYRVHSAGPDIVLHGRCAVCNGEVSRVVEQE